MRSRPLLSVNGIVVVYGRRRHRVCAVDCVSFSVGAAETLAIIGESGSGKSSIAKAVLGATPVESGQIVFDGAELLGLGRKRHRQGIGIVFQDPYSAFNPARTIQESVAEPLLALKSLTPEEVASRVHRALARVGLVGKSAIGYPADFSGGQLQRAAIARALIAEPRLVICDEPVSSLDLSLQGQVLNLLREIQEETGVAYIFVSHDIAVVEHFAGRTIALYRGRVVEEGPTSRVCGVPMHPYTRDLVSALPLVDPVAQRERRERHAPASEPLASVGSESGGCSYAPRCRYSMTKCWHDEPAMEWRGSAAAACHRVDEIGQLDSCGTSLPTGRRDVQRH